MPFTVSHIAAVVPFHRPLSRLHVFTAAVIGSMVPDFGIFVTSDVLRWQTHSIRSLLTFCLPVGVISYWLTELLIRPAMQEVLPDRAYARLAAGAPPASLWNARHWVLIVVAILFGAGTHLVWDDFTHEDSRGVRMFPVLTDLGPEVGGHPLRIYLWLQYASSGLGLLAVLLALVLWWRHARLPQSPVMRRVPAWERAVWMSAYPLVPLVDLIVNATRQWPASVTSVSQSLREMAIGSMRWAIIALIVISALLRLRLGWVRPRPSATPRSTA